MSEENSLNRKEIIKEGNLEHKEKIFLKNGRGINIDFPFPLEYSKLCLICGIKIITLMWSSKLIMMIGNIYENCIIMCSMFLKGKIFHFYPQEGNARALGGRNLF